MADWTASERGHTGSRGFNETAGHRHSLARHPSSVFGGQEHRDPRDILRLPKSSQETIVPDWIARARLSHKPIFRHLPMGRQALFSSRLICLRRAACNATDVRHL